MSSDVLKSRLWTYNLIRDLLVTEPNKEMLLSLAQSDELRSLGDISDGANQITEFLKTLKTSDIDIIVEELREEYRRLFVGPSFLPAPLWESVALSRDHLMFGEQTFHVRQAYAQFGLSFVRQNHEPEDHVVTELEFMAFLIQQMIALDLVTNRENFHQYLEAQITFLKDHILPWVPQSFEMIASSTSNMFYQGLAQFIIEFLTCDLELTLSLTSIREEIINE